MANYLDKNGVQYLWNKMKTYVDGKVSGGGCTYSTTEQFTGDYWIDGKPIYQKTIQFTNKLKTGFNQISHNVSNIGDFRQVINSGFMYSNTVWALGSYSTGTAFVTFDTIGTTQIGINVGSGWNNILSGFITIQYTKTTN